MMWKAVIADDEAIIANGLKKLIDWKGLGVSIEADARNGEQLLEEIERVNPDLVITDIRMPRLTGLEVLHRVSRTNRKIKFIFISGYEDFSYAKDAMKNGAVDYLLKPVNRRELEEAVRRAITGRENQEKLEFFSEKEESCCMIRGGAGQIDNEQILSMLRERKISLKDSFAVGVCVGLRPDIARSLERQSFQKYNLLRFSVFNRLEHLVEQTGRGLVIRADQDALYLMGVFERGRERTFIKELVEPMIRRVEREYQVELCVGIGMIADQSSMLRTTYSASKFAFNMYFFVEKQRINIAHVHRNYTVSDEDYRECAKQALFTIAAKGPDALEKISDVLDTIGELHYGNRYAVGSKLLHFSEDLFSKLADSHLLLEDPHALQNQLQELIESRCTLRELKTAVREFYTALLNRIYKSSRTRDKLLMEEVKDYIRDHYTEELTVREMAGIACVSQNYFSALFKSETGETFKTYVTTMRMQEALRLLRETDDKMYVISEKVGYSSFRRFSNVFKETYQVSPTEYRKRLRGM